MKRRKGRRRRRRRGRRGFLVAFWFWLGGFCGGHCGGGEVVGSFGRDLVFFGGWVLVCVGWIDGEW